MNALLKHIVVVALVAAPAFGAGAQEEEPAGEQLLSRSIAYHDPEGVGDHRQHQRQPDEVCNER